MFISSNDWEQHVSITEARELGDAWKYLALDNNDFLLACHALFRKMAGGTRAMLKRHPIMKCSSYIMPGTKSVELILGLNRPDQGLFTVLSRSSKISSRRPLSLLMLWIFD